jgi:4-diphosphocytidyl-2-C-methyl-D-erythritol kinase
MTDTWLETQARAKVNLRLKIFPRRPDGFHPLQTLFCRIDLADRVRVRLRSGPGVSIRVNGPELAPEGPDNLAARAAAALIAHAGIRIGAEVELEKVIPVGSGLGGGSSDAAAVLRLLAQVIEPVPQPGALMQLAANLGSDVPFFAADVPVALASGRGEKLVAPAGPSIAARPMLLLIPDARVSTAEAYGWWDEHSGENVGRIESLAHPGTVPGSWEDIAALAENDFEPVIYARDSGLASMRRVLGATEPDIALLSGSGSSLFAVYDSERRRDEAARRIGAECDAVQLISARGPV